MTFTPADQAALLKRYSERLLRLGPTDEALGWTKPKQDLRYHILLEYWHAKGPQPLRILDFGCGFGGLYSYANTIGAQIDYTGIDLNSDLVEVARERYPQTRFLCANVFEPPLSETFDVVLSSGVHNHVLTDNQAFTERTFELFDRCSTVGFAVNFLSTRVNHRNASNHYSEPGEILTTALKYSPRVALRHDYMPFEFTIFVDKRIAVDDSLMVFAPFLDFCGR